MKVKVNCLRCDKVFLARQADINRGWGKFCSKSCKAKKQTAKQHDRGEIVHRDNHGDLSWITNIQYDDDENMGNILANNK